MLAKPLYVVPFLMAYSPILMDPGSSWWDILLVWTTAFIGFFSMAIAFEGFFRRPLTRYERILFAAAALLFFFQVWWLKAAAFILLGLGVTMLYLLHRKTDSVFSTDKQIQADAQSS
jgi:TRAP-type uncharacterized transport system fused permease subunit